MLASLALVMSASACAMLTDFEAFRAGDGGTPGSEGGASASSTSSTSGSSTSSSGSSGGDDGSTDGATSTTSSSGASTSSTSSTSSSSGSTTSSSGAAPDAGLDCTGTTFCDGYERESAQGPWPDFNLAKGATFAITHDHPRHGTSALRLSLTTQAGAAAMLLKPIASPKTIDLKYAFWVAAATKATNFFALAFNNGTNERGLFLSLKDGQARFADQLTENGNVKSYTESAAVTVPSGQWVDVAVTFDVTTRSLNASLGGTPLFTDHAVADLPTTSALLLGGVSYTASGPPFDIDVDDVRLTVTP